MIKTNFYGLQKELALFERKTHFDKTPKSVLVRWLNTEIKHYKKSVRKQDIENKLSDIIVLTLQIANREKISLDKAWMDHWKRSQKYLK